MSEGNVILVEDDNELRESLKEILELQGFSVTSFATADTALASLQYNSDTVVVSDIRMPVMDGITFLKHLQQLDSALPVIMISGHADIETALESIKLGAFDFVEKPLRPERLIGLVEKATQHRH